MLLTDSLAIIEYMLPHCLVANDTLLYPSQIYSMLITLLVHFLLFSWWQIKNWAMIIWLWDWRKLFKMTSLLLMQNGCKNTLVCFHPLNIFQYVFLTIRQTCACTAVLIMCFFFPSGGKIYLGLFFHLGVNLRVLLTGYDLRKMLKWPRPLPLEEERVRLMHEVANTTKI